LLPDFTAGGLKLLTPVPSCACWLIARFGYRKLEMFNPQFAVIPVILWCFLASIACGREPVKRKPLSLPVEELKKCFSCGPNSLYLFLRLHNQEITLDEVNKVVPLGTHGTSLLQLKDSAAQLGVQTRIFRCTWDDLVHCPKPAIAYLNQFNEAVAGHYVVVLAADHEKNVDFIDGSDGVLYHNRHGFFTQGWTGYLLIPASHSESHWDIVITLAFWASIGLAVWLTGPSVRLSVTQPWQVGHNSLRAWFVVCGLGILLCPGGARSVQPSLSGSQSDSFTEYWRTHENDGLTCLYVLLSLEGDTVNYADLRKEIMERGSDHDRTGMVALRQAGQHHGLNLDIRKCSIKEMTADHLPVIALTEEAQETGAFVVVLWLAGDRCGILDGYGRYNQVSVDDFRRRFTGYALVLQPPSRLWMVFAGIGWSVLIVYGGWRIQPSWQLHRNSHLEICSQKGECPQGKRITKGSLGKIGKIIS
jgi:hypothetical protein